MYSAITTLNSTEHNGHKLQQHRTMMIDTMGAAHAKSAQLPKFRVAHLQAGGMCMLYEPQPADIPQAFRPAFAGCLLGQNSHCGANRRELSKAVHQLLQVIISPAGNNDVSRLQTVAAEQM
jgi:hypothetical protein